MSGTGFYSPLPIWLETYFRILLDAISEAVLILNEQSQVVFANRPSEQLFGYSATELRGQNLRVLVPSSRTNAAQPANCPATRTGYDLFGLCKDGTEIPIEITLTPIQVLDRMLVIAAIQDVTDRQKIEDRFRGLLELAPDAMVIVDKNGKIALVNAQTETLFGYKRTELIGQSVELLIPERYRDQHPKHRQIYSARPRVRPMGLGLELSGRRKDRSEFPVEISLGPLRFEDGVYVISAIRDMSERKRAEEQIRELQDELDKADRKRTSSNST